MSFWRFGFAGQSSLDALLAAASPTEAEALPTLTLEQLLEEDDLLQEVKAQHSKLLTFLARPHIVRRLLQYVDGSAFDYHGLAPEESEDERERKRRKYPYLCSEVLCAEVWSIVDVIFRSPELYLVSFWDSVLDREAGSSPTESFQLALWAKVNGAWLGTKTTEMIAFIKASPNIVERLVAHIAAPSIADLFFRLVQCEEIPASKGIIEWLAGEQLVARLVALLAPGHPPDTHTTVAEFLKAVVAFCSNANAAAATAELRPTQSNPSPSYSGWNGEDSASASSASPGPRWASNRLLRDLASLDTVTTLVGYILDPPSPDTTLHVSIKEARETTPMPNGHVVDDAVTPRPHNQELPSRTPSPPKKEGNDDGASAASSLIQSTSVLIDLIRKNNSDFTEQQILNVLRKQAREDDIAASTNQTIKPREGPIGPSVVQLDNLLNVVSSRLADFQRLLLDPPRRVAQIDTTLGQIEPLTIERFRICELYAELLHCSNMALLNREAGAAPLYDEDGYIVGGTEAIDALASALAPGETGAELSPSLNTSLNGPSTSAFTSTYSSPALASADDQLPHLDRLTVSDSPPRARSGEPSEASTPSAPQSGRTSPSVDSETGYLTRDEARALKDLLARGDGEDLSFDFSPPARPPEKPRRFSVSAGQRLKASFLQQNVVGTLLDLFFAFPWNNLLHNCVYDLVQQVLGGRTDRALSRRLCHSLFLDCHLPQRILEGYNRNASEKKFRLGFMGHMTLIADEVVKFSTQHEEDSQGVLTSAFPQPQWDRYVSSALREARDRDLQPLGGGVTQPVMEAHQASLAFSDEDDEFPMSGAGGQKTKDLHDGIPAADEVDVPTTLGQASDGAGAVSTGKATDTPTNDQFARYLVSQISGDLPDKFSGASSDEEDTEEVVGWVGDSTFDPKDVEFELNDADRDPPSFGFDDRWDSINSRVLAVRRHSDEDDGFGDFVSPHAAGPSNTNSANPFAADAFRPDSAASSRSSTHIGKNLTPADWTADWQDEVDDRDPFGDDEAEGDSDDDFGHFKSGGSSGPMRKHRSITESPLSPEPSGDIDFSAFSPSVEKAVHVP